MSQRVVVTAAASGIGREIVRAFVASGAKVFVCDIDAKGLELLAQELPGLTTKVCDVSNREDIERMVAFGVDALGGLDVLVNNALKKFSPGWYPRFRSGVTPDLRRSGARRGVGEHLPALYPDFRPQWQAKKAA